MIPAFERMTRSVLAILGEDALFNGVTVTKINIEYDVQFAGIDGEAAMYRGDISVAKDVATLSNEVLPQQGRTFQLFTPADKAAGAIAPTGQRYRLDKFVDKNGYSQRYIVMKVA